MKTPENFQTAYWDYMDHWFEEQKKLNRARVQRTKIKKYLTLLRAVIATLSVILGFVLVLQPAGEPLGPDALDPDLLGVILIFGSIILTVFGPIIGGSDDDLVPLPPPEGSTDFTGPKTGTDDHND